MRMILLTEIMSRECLLNCMSPENQRLVGDEEYLENWEILTFEIIVLEIP